MKHVYSVVTAALLLACCPAAAWAQYGAPCYTGPVAAYPGAASVPHPYLGNSFSFSSPATAYYPSYYPPAYAPSYYQPSNYTPDFSLRVLPPARYYEPGPYYYTPTYSYTPGYYSFYNTPGYFRY